MYAHNHRSILNGTPLDARFTNVALLAAPASASGLSQEDAEAAAKHRLRVQ